MSKVKKNNENKDKSRLKELLSGILEQTERQKSQYGERSIAPSEILERVIEGSHEHVNAIAYLLKSNKAIENLLSVLFEWIKMKNPNSEIQHINVDEYIYRYIIRN